MYYWNDFVLQNSYTDGIFQTFFTNPNILKSYSKFTFSVPKTFFVIPNQFGTIGKTFLDKMEVTLCFCHMVYFYDSETFSLEIVLL